MPENGELLFLRCGSPGYVAPELLGDQGYDWKSDVFSAGVICYVLLSGRQVFKGADVQAVLASNKLCEFDFPEKYWSTISFEARDLVTKLLNKDPNERISASQALSHQWFTKDLQDYNSQTRRNFTYKPQDTIKDSTLISVTPVMAGRKLKDLPPETPFLSSKNAQPADSTPIIKGLAPRNGLKQMNVFGMQVKQPVTIEPQKANPFALPAFKKPE